MPDFLDQKRSEITARLKELKPLVDEYHRLEAAAAALGALPSSSATAPRAPRSRRARTTSTATGGTKRGRPKGSGKRGTEALELVKAHPGITIPEIAEKMGIKQNYLYRVLPSLQSEGLVIKEGRGWLPANGG